jgi:4-hydroxybenzoate polyprenyltransferase
MTHHLLFFFFFFFLITCTLNTIIKLLDRQFDTSQGLENFPLLLCSESTWYSPNILHMVTTVLTPRVHKLNHLPSPVSAFRMCEVQLHTLRLHILYELLSMLCCTFYFKVTAWRSILHMPIPACAHSDYWWWKILVSLCSGRPFKMFRKVHIQFIIF